MTSIILTLVTILASGLTSAVVTYRLNRSKEQTFFMRKKAEELYRATDEFGRDFGSHMVTFLPVLEGSIDYNQMLDLQRQTHTKKLHGGAETMEMLVRIYFPEVEGELDRLFAVRDEFSKIRSAHKAAYKEGFSDDERFEPAFRATMKKADVAIKELKAAIVRTARRHAEENDSIFGRFARPG